MSSPPTDRQNIASFAVDLVCAMGARTAFSLTGGMAMYLNRAVQTAPGLQAVYCQHEQACVAAADGYAKASDYKAPGLAVVTAGPGVTNAVTSLCAAFGDSTPMVVLAGQVKLADIDLYGTRTHGAQEVRSRELIEPCVKHFVRLTAKGAAAELSQALALAFSGRPGPVFIEIPLDVQNLPLAYDQASLTAALADVRGQISGSRSPDDETLLTQALTWLGGAERPLIYVGAGCRIAGAAGAVVAFAETRGIPVLTSWPAADAIPAEHPLNFGAPGGLASMSANAILYRADRLLFLGARLDLGTTAYQRDDFGGQAERWIVDVDPTELAKFAGLERVKTLQVNLSSLPAAVRGMAPPADRDKTASWLQWCRAQSTDYLEQERLRLARGAMNVFGVAGILSKWSANKVFTPSGSGAGIETFIRFFGPRAGSRCFFGASLGAMGLGLPHAIGAAFAQERPVICIEGDGGLMLNLQELATLSHYGPKGFVLFVLNNDGYLSIRASQERHFGATGGADLASGVFIPDYGDIAKAFHLGYRRIESLAQLESLMEGLDAEAPPILVDLIVDKSEPRGPTVRTVIGEDGKLSSTSLAELQW
jgi:acetolactate synthase-1/2/3 large subunit